MNEQSSLSNWILEMVPCSWHGRDWVRLAFWVYFKIILIFCCECRWLDWESAYIGGSLFVFKLSVGKCISTPTPPRPKCFISFVCVLNG